MVDNLPPLQTMAAAVINVVARENDANPGTIGKALMNMGFEAPKDFITIYQMSKPCHFQIQVRPEIEEKIKECIDNNRNNVQDVMRILRANKSIMVTRVFGTITNAALEELLFPPRYRPTQVISHQVEQVKTTTGKKLWYTGRRWITISEEDFTRIKQYLPTHIAGDGHTMFVNFEGSKQSCFNCGQKDHLAKECKAPQRSQQQPPPPQQSRDQPPANNLIDQAFKAAEARTPAYIPSTQSSQNQSKSHRIRRNSKRKTSENSEHPESKRDESDEEEDQPALSSDESRDQTTNNNDWTTVNRKKKFPRKTLPKNQYEVPVPQFIKAAYPIYAENQTMTRQQLKQLTKALHKNPFFTDMNIPASLSYAAHPSFEDFFVYTSDSEADEYT